MSGMGTTETPTPMVGNEMHIDWSRRYQLTPLEQKRLQAMGLSKEEVWAVAKAAHESNEDVDTVADMVLRGRTYWQIANELNIPYDSLFKWPQRWQSPEWADQVRAGSPVFIPRSAGMTGENGEMNRGGMGQRGEMMREENGGQASVQPASTATCPVCHMKLSTVQTAANSRAVVINGTTYYCCSGCDMSKATQ
jgi:YHS domain-containing protein